MDDNQRQQMNALRAHLMTVKEEEITMANTDAVQVDAAHDGGNSTSVTAVRVNGTIRVAKMQTAAAFSLALPPKLESDDHVFYDAHGTPSKAVGMGALRYGDGEVITARGSQDRYGAFQVDFFLANLASLVKAPAIVVNTLALTAPAKYFDDVRDVMVLAFRKTHTRNYRGRQITVEVRSVKVFREGEAALANLAKLAKGATILIEGGGGQTHIALARNGVLMTDPVTRETGLQRVIDKADDVILANHKRRLTQLERYEMERAIAAGQDYHIIVNGKKVKVSHLAIEQYDAVAPLIISDIQSIVPKWRNFETIILAGGQAYHLTKQYKAAFANLVVADKPDEQNARGALILAGLNSAEVCDVAA